MEKYRVFISYSHDEEDKEDIKTVVNVLKENGLDPIYDKNIQGGQPFGEIIKRYIQHSHVFVPIITKQSSTRGWVHQEIGYAASLNIPIIPVSKGELNLPKEMLRELHAVRLDDVDNLKENLSYKVFEDLIVECPLKNVTYFCSEQPAERAVTMATLANNAKSMNFTGLLRQRGGLSSFHIPDKIISNKVWTKRYHPFLKNEYHCKCQLGERKALEKHALESGCKLIINPAIITNNRYHPIAQRARLQTFLDFLETIPNDKIDIAIDEDMGTSESVTLLGDIFAAESYFRSETQGFMYTMFTTHAVAVQNKAENFDCEFEALLDENGTKEGETLEKTKELIHKLISEIK